MNTTRLGLGVLGGALAIGVLADWLLRGVPWGVNISLCTAALLAVGTVIVRYHRLRVPPEAPWLALTALLSAVAYARFASPVLQFLDFVSLLAAGALLAWRFAGGTVRRAEVAGYVRAGIHAMVAAVVGACVVVLRDVRWSAVAGQGRTARLRAAGVGVLLAAPLLLVFSALFASADTAFAAFVTGVVRFEMANLVEHAALTALWGGIAAGVLWGAFIARPTKGAALPVPSLGFTTVGTALGLVALLFTAFVALQVRYLFGGEAVVESTAGLTYAQFARRGFFEMVTAAGLALPMLLGAERSLRPDTPGDARSFRALATVFLLLLGVLLASALQRMLLYVSMFGLTELRVYVTAFLVWIAGMLAWFAWTVLRGRRRRFAYGALVQGWAVLAGLHIVNPDALIARTNLARAARDAALDTRYLADLSADAVPAIAAGLARLEPAERDGIALAMAHRWGERDPDADWRSWNWSRERARKIVAAID